MSCESYFEVMHLAIQALSLVYRHATETKETTVSNERNIKLKMLTGRRQTDWLFRKPDRGLEIETTERQISIAVRGGLEAGTSGLQHHRT